MYERSAIILEKNISELLNFNKAISIKSIYDSYQRIVEDIKEYLDILGEEKKVISEFEEVANSIQVVQEEQSDIYNRNKILEDARFSLFHDFSISPEELDEKVASIENELDENNKALRELRVKYNSTFNLFNERQKQRAKINARKKEIEKRHLDIVQDSLSLYRIIDINDAKALKEFVSGNSDDEKVNVLNKLIENGKNEKVPFDKTVLASAVNYRFEIAKIEAQTYALAFDRFRQLLRDINKEEDIVIAKYEKSLRDIKVKIDFINSCREYLAGYLDNERMAAFNGQQKHQQLMEEANKAFEKDIEQFTKLYEIIEQEASNKVTRETYIKLYNYQYLLELDTQNSITQGFINSNAWRIDNIKNVYRVLKNGLTSAYGRDVSEFENGAKKAQKPNKVVEINVEENKEATQQVEKKDNVVDINESKTKKEQKKQKDEENYLDFDDGYEEYGYDVEDYEPVKFKDNIEFKQEIEKKSKQNIEENLKDILGIKTKTQQKAKEEKQENIQENIQENLQGNLQEEILDNEITLIEEKHQEPKKKTKRSISRKKNVETPIVKEQENLVQDTPNEYIEEKIDFSNLFEIEEDQAEEIKEEQEDKKVKSVTKKILVTDEEDIEEDFTENIEDSFEFDITSGNLFEDLSDYNEENEIPQFEFEEVLHKEAASTFGDILYENASDEYDDGLMNTFNFKINSPMDTKSKRKKISFEEPHLQASDFDKRLQQLKDKKNQKTEKQTGLFGKLFK